MMSRLSKQMGKNKTKDREQTNTNTRNTNTRTNNRGKEDTNRNKNETQTNRTPQHGRPQRKWKRTQRGTEAAPNTSTTIAYLDPLNCVSFFVPCLLLVPLWFNVCLCFCFLSVFVMQWYNLYIYFSNLFVSVQYNLLHQLDDLNEQTNHHDQQINETKKKQITRTTTNRRHR